MQALAPQTRGGLNVYPHQADALFLMTLRPTQVVLPRQPGKTTIQKEFQKVGRRESDVSGSDEVASLYFDSAQARLCLWIVYNVIANDNSNGLADSKIIWWVKSNYNMESKLINSCLKALSNIFECVSVFTFPNDKKCKKRYTTNRKDQALIQGWCKSYERENPNMEFVKSRLCIQ